MTPFTRVWIHSSQYPQNVRRDLLHSLGTRQVDHKFHYDTVGQTQRWLAVHRALSPACTDPDCSQVYEQCFDAVTKGPGSGLVQVIGLGCGAGEKDARLLRRLCASNRRVFYTPCDVSVPLVVIAHQLAASIIPENASQPVVLNLLSVDDLSAVLAEMPGEGARRLITFFGMIPNFEPPMILPRLAGLLRPADHLLFSANLAPGPDYAAGVQKIMPQYDNALTHEWLLTFLTNLGVERPDGVLRFGIENCPVLPELKRVAAYFHFVQSCSIAVDQTRFEFTEGEAIRLFFSYRYTPDKLRAVLARCGITTREQWITGSGEEGVFLCQKV
jgi:uncharacterized SAM-dependent methyltransferase